MELKHTQLQIITIYSGGNKNRSDKTTYRKIMKAI
jgi:hypothetical protein